MTTQPHPARPKFAIGQTVAYLDRTERPQTGKVLRIEATWNRYWPEHPSIGLTVTHPTYSNGLIYLTEKEVRALTEDPDR